MRKRIMFSLQFLFVFCLFILPINFNVCASDYQLNVAQPVFTDLNDAPIFDLIPNGFVKAKFSAENLSDSPLQATLILVLYKPGGTIQNIAFNEKVIQGKTVENVTAGINLPGIIDGFYVHVFAWDNLTNMKPFSIVYNFPNTKTPLPSPTSTPLAKMDTILDASDSIAKLTDINNNPLSGKKLTISVSGNISYSETAVTNAQGIASFNLVSSSLGAGRMESGYATVHFSGDGSYNSSSDDAGYVTVRGNPSSTLTVDINYLGNQSGTHNFSISCLYNNAVPYIQGLKRISYYVKYFGSDVFQYVNQENLIFNSEGLANSSISLDNVNDKERNESLKAVVNIYPDTNYQPVNKELIVPIN